MPKFTSSQAKAYYAAAQASFQSGTIKPLADFEVLYGPIMPAWATRGIDKIEYDIGQGITYSQVLANKPLGAVTLKDDAVFVDALVELGPVGSGAYRTARVYTVLDMTYGDFLEGVNRLRYDWELGTSNPQAVETRIVIPIWRTHPV